MNLFQIIKKIRRMTVREIFFRLSEQIKIRLERRAYSQTLAKVSRPDFNFLNTNLFWDKFKTRSIKKLMEDPGFARRISPVLDGRKRDMFLKEYPEETAQTIRRADAFLEHRFSFLGVSFQLPKEIPWQSDPVSLNPYPTGFYRDIDIFTNQNAGDVKHVWEVNRLQFLIEIAKAYYLTEEEKYREKLEFFIRDWYEKNPYKTGIAWASALEVGVRVLALIWTLNFYLAGKKQDNELLAILLKLIYLHGEFLTDNLSVYFSPYNHLIGETAGLFAVGYLFPGFKGTDKWQHKAWKILKDQVHKQFHPDGGSVEQATFYHHFTLGFFVQAVAFRKINDDSVPRDMKQKIEKAMEFAMFLTRPDGTLPHMGDIDDARSVYFSNPTNWDFKFFQSIGAAWFGRTDMKFVAGTFKEEAFWLLTTSDYEKFKKIPVQEPNSKSILLKHSGYAVFRSGYDEFSHYSQIDCGPIADGLFPDARPSAAHGHADLLAVEIACFGEPHLIDPGFSNYRGDFNWHAYFRSTAAHNTLEINGHSQAKQGGILVWSHAPDFKQLDYLEDGWAQAFCGEHYGYQSEPGMPVHRRYMAFVENTFWVVLDIVYPQKNSEKKISITENLHFDPMREVKLKHNSIHSYGKKSQLTIWFKDNISEQHEIEQIKGGRNAEDGWVSPTYRAVHEAMTIRVKRKTGLPYQSLKIMVPALLETNELVKMAEDDSLFDLTVSEKNYQIRYNFNESQKKNFLEIISRESKQKLIFKDGLDGQWIATDRTSA